MNGEFWGGHVVAASGAELGCAEIIIGEGHDMICPLVTDFRL